MGRAATGAPSRRHRARGDQRRGLASPEEPGRMRWRVQGLAGIDEVSIQAFPVLAVLLVSQLSVVFSCGLMSAIPERYRTPRHSARPAGCHFPKIFVFLGRETAPSSALLGVTASWAPSRCSLASRQTQRRTGSSYWPPRSAAGGLSGGSLPLGCMESYCFCMTVFALCATYFLALVV